MLSKARAAILVTALCLGACGRTSGTATVEVAPEPATVGIASLQGADGSGGAAGPPGKGTGSGDSRASGAVDAGGPDTVVLLSLDGMRSDYPDQVRGGAFERLEREGLRAGELVHCFPAATFPSHATLATGACPDRHGIINNKFVDSERGAFSYERAASWYRIAPLWVHATRAGVKTWVFHWAACVGDWRGTKPARSVPWRDVEDSERLASLIDWLALPGGERPQLVMAYWRGCDRDGHRYGPDSDQVRACVARADGLLTELLGAIEGLPHGRRITLFVVSDHGMTTTQGIVDVARALPGLDKGVEVVSGGAVTNVYLHEGSEGQGGREGDEGRAVRAREVLRAASSIPHTQAFLGDADGWRYRAPGRTGNVVVVAAPGYRMGSNRPGAGVLRRVTGQAGGHHGHRGEDPDMAAMLFAWGAGVPAGGKVETMRSVDVAPTVAAWLGIPPLEEAEGRAVLTRAPAVSAP